MVSGRRSKQNRRRLHVQAAFLCPAKSGNRRKWAENAWKLQKNAGKTEQKTNDSEKMKRFCRKFVDSGRHF